MPYEERLKNSFLRGKKKNERWSCWDLQNSTWTITASARFSDRRGHCFRHGGSFAWGRWVWKTLLYFVHILTTVLICPDLDNVSKPAKFLIFLFALHDFRGWLHHQHASLSFEKLIERKAFWLIMSYSNTWVFTWHFPTWPKIGKKMLMLEPTVERGENTSD